MAADLPCDGDGVCMVCKVAPPEAEVVTCHTCTTPWHAPCLARPLPSLTSVIDWECPDCSPSAEPVGPASTSSAAAAAPAPTGGSSELVAAIRAIEADATLTEKEKARRRQALLGGGTGAAAKEEEEKARKGKGRETDGDDMLDLIDEKFKCAFCMQLPERPVTTPCGHNFCLRCFQKWIGQGKHSCVQCRAAIPSKMASQPRINSALVQAIRMARTAKSSMSSGVTQVYHFMRNEDRPDTAFTTERAKRAGKANACSGQIFVTVPPDHFGPILAENDPKRNQGVLVGEIWEDRMECRQWGAHFPHVAGIAGQSDYGAQSVALSGGYEDDEDHGEWFLYTGSGGRDLSGNKRTNKEQAFDQKFEKLNEALRVSCKKGYPVRVVRSHKEKRSSYAPESGVRYDGIYRIEKCWRKVGTQGFKVCRYLFIRCDNSPAPWTSDEHGDRVRPLPDIKELKAATDITIRKDSPAWDYDEEVGWRWTRDPPVSRKQVHTADPQERERARKAIRRAHKHSIKERLKKEFGCLVCRNVMTSPLTTPCGHNFCKPCLLGSYADQSFVRERICEGGRSLRSQKIVKKCPSCMADITDFLQNPQVNRELNDLVETLKRKCEEEEAEQFNEEGSEEVKSSVDNCDGLEEKNASENGDIVSQQKPSMEGSSSPKGAEITLEESNARVQETLDTTKGISVVKSENVGIGEEGKKNGQNLVMVSSPRSSRKRQNTPVDRSCKKAKNCNEVHNDMDQKLEINTNDAKLEDEGGQQKKPVGRPRKNSKKDGDEGQLQKKPVGRPRKNAKKDEDDGQVQNKPAGRPRKKAKKTNEDSTEMDQKSNGDLVDSELKDSASSVGNLAISEKVGGKDDAQNQVGSSKKVTPKKISEGRKPKDVEAADEDFQ